MSYTASCAYAHAQVDIFNAHVKMLAFPLLLAKEKCILYEHTYQVSMKAALVYVRYEQLLATSINILCVILINEDSN